ncbi:MAG TPA: ABC transporter permease [Planctomycetota bacterium]|jgi:ribose transport system permease protein
MTERTPPWLRAALADYLGMVLVLAGLVTYFGCNTEHFFERSTFLSIANQIPDAVIIAAGMTFVLIIGGIDLSVGSVLALSAGVLGKCMAQHHFSCGNALLAAVCVGAACGALNGLLTVGFGLPSFIVTLGMLEIARGGAYMVTDSKTQYIGSAIGVLSQPASTPWLATLTGGLTLPFALAVIVVLVCQFILSKTVFGRYMIAIGTNEEAVRLSGIDTRRIKVVVFMICGLLAGLAAVLQTSRLESADPNAGTGAELQAIAAVVIGGTSLLGGRGSVVNSFFGVVVIAVLGAGLAQMGVGETTKRMITGVVIVAAVILDHYRHRILNARRA